MTRLPTESWNIVARPDLPSYTLNAACPVTGELTGLEDHHIVRRSFGKDFRDSWFVEYPDGVVIGNRINLSNQAHYRITTNRARIVYKDGRYYWDEAGDIVELRWQPPVYKEFLDPLFDPTSKDSPAVAALAARVDELVGASPTATLAPGTECFACHRRIPHPKKKTSPKTSVFSTRIPVDDAEAFDELLVETAKHLGVYEKPHWKFWTINYSAAATLQDGSLKDALS